MSSLTTCLKKVGAALAAEDKAAVLARAGALRAEGLSATDAGRQAVDERLAEVAGQIGKVQPLVPEAAAPAVAKQAPPQVTRFVTKNDMVGSAVEWQEQEAGGTWKRLTTFDTMDAAKASAASQGYDAEAIPRFVSEFSATAKRFLPAAPEPAAPAQPAPASEAMPPAPAPVSSREGQMNLANRGSRIASLKAMNEQLRRVAPGEAWADANIESASNAELDRLQDAISAALVAATRGPAAVNPLRAELEGMSGAELRAIMERMSLAGARMVQEERVAALLAEDPAEVRAAMQAMAADQLQALNALEAKLNRRFTDSPLTEEVFDAMKKADLMAGTFKSPKFTDEGRARHNELKAAENERDLAIADAQDLASDGMPFKASAVDKYGMAVPPGYERDGDVFKRAAKPAAQPITEKPVSAFEAFKAAMRAIYDGTASVEDYKAAYQRVREADAVKAELGKLTKDELIRTFGIMARPDEKKDSLIASAYKAMLRGFALGKEFGPRSYMMTRGGLENYERLQAEALDAIVENHTAEDLAAYAAEVKAEREEKIAKRAALVESVKDPKTLDDFRSHERLKMSEGLTPEQARMSLTPEQRALRDDLAADYSRSRRTAVKDDQRTQVRVAGQTVDGNIIATKHTKKGHDLFVVQLAERVSREDYETLNAGAKKIGGYYSSFRGSGAIAGFQFTTREQAQAFVTLAGGDASAAKEAAQERRDAYADDRSQTAAERLAEMADAMEAGADESLSRDRKANTDRRARFAAAAEASAREAKAMAKTMRNLAEALNSGKAKFLDRIRTKTQVQLLQTYVGNAKFDERRAKYPTYSEQEKHKGEPPTQETADHAVFPEFTAFRSDLASLGRQLQDVDGTKKLGDRLMKVADDVSDAFTAWAKEPGNLFRLSTFSVRAGDEVRTAIFKDRETAEKAIKRSGLTGKAIVFAEKRGVNRIIMSPSEAIARGLWTGDGDKRITLSDEFGTELVESMGRANRRGAKVSVPWQFERAYERRKQLQRMGIETPAEFRAALREFIGLREQAAEADKIKVLERAMVGRRNDGLDFFPTPEGVADEMIAAADLQPGMRVLEPSAGMGHIADQIRAAGAEPEVIEMANDRRELLEAKGFNVVGRDFLDFNDANHAERGFTFGDLMEAPDGTRGILRGQGGMGSDRVRLVSEDGRERGKFNFSELTGIERRGVGSGYDRILMNPPFSDRRDAAHVLHAYSLLKPGGRLVAIMGEGVFFGQDKKATAFREWMESLGASDEKLPSGTFMDPSLPVNTGVSARMVVIEKPEEYSSGDRARDEALRESLLPKKDEPKLSRRGSSAVNLPPAAIGGSLARVNNHPDYAEAKAGDVEASLRLARDLVTDGFTEEVRQLMGSQGGVLLPVLAQESAGRNKIPLAVAEVLAERMGVETDLEIAQATRTHRTDMDGLSRVLKSPEFYGTVKTGQRYLLVDDTLTQGGTFASLANHIRAGGGEVLGVAALSGKRYSAALSLSDEYLTQLRERFGDVEGAFRAATGYGFDGLTESEGRYLVKHDAPEQVRDRILAAGREAGFREDAGVDGPGSRDRRLSSESPRERFRRLLGVPARGIPLAQARQMARAYEDAGLRGVNVAATPADLPADLRRRLEGAADDVRGAYFPDRDQTWVFSDRVNDPDEFAFVVLHEAFHRGLGKTFGRDAKRLMGQMYQTNRRLRERADKVEAELQIGRDEAIEEALADMAGEGRAQKLRGWTKLSALIRTWLGKVLDAVGLRMTFSDAQIETFVSAMAREGLRNDARITTGAGVDRLVAASKAARQEQTETPAFKRWFGDSKVVDAQGEPLVVYHGTGRDFPAFDPTKVGSTFNSDRSGFFFSSDPATASDYAEFSASGGRPAQNGVTGANVMPVYVSLKNPLTLQKYSASPGGSGLKKRHGDGADALTRIFDEDRDFILRLAKEGGHDGILFENDGHRLVVAFRPERIKSATGNNGSFDPANQDIRFSRRASTSIPAQAAAQGINIQSLRNAVMDRFRDAGTKVSWWDKTLGTQFDKAKRLPAFGKVFDRVQQYLEDTSTLANEAADQAPSILPKLDSVRDVWDAAKRGLSAKDREAIKAPIFEGTLIWTRDENGKLIRQEEAEAKADKLTSDEKSRVLLRSGKLAPGVLKMWLGLPIDQYEQNIKTSYAKHMLEPGAVFTPDELRSLYKLTDAQIKQYQEFRAAVNTSLDQVVATDALRMLGDVAELTEELHRAAVGDREGFRAALNRILDARIEAGGDEVDVNRLKQLRGDLEAKYAKVDALKARGYAPLMRFGTFKVVVPGKNGEDVDFFALYETKAEANAAARSLNELPEFRGRVEQGTLSEEAYKLFAQVPLESLEMFAEAIGAEQSEVFQEYLRMAKNNRSALKRLIQRKGIAGYNEDVSRVLASFVTSNARMAAGTVNLAQAKEAAQDIREGDVKDEAIRLIETVQNPTETAGALRGLMFVHFIGGSIASAIVNVTQPVMMTTPYLSQWGGMAKASARLLAAARQASSGKIADQELAEALRRAEKDGIVSPQEIHHLTAEAMQTFGRNPVLKRAAFLWGAPFSLAEQFNRRVTFLAAYQTAKAEGMVDPFEFAERAVIETQGLYNRGNAPNLARNPIGAVALTFKQYSIHYLEWLRRMWNTGAPDSPERTAGRKAVLFALAMLMLAGGVEGLPFTEDLNDLADTFMQAAGIDTSAKGWKRDFFANTLGLGDEGADVVMRGFSAVGGFPMDVSMRMGMGNLLPGTGMLLRSNTDVSRDVLELAGPAGSLLSQAKDAGQKALSGDAAGAATALLPVALQNAAKGLQMLTTGEARDTKGRKIMDADEMDAAMKIIGFQPAEIARESSKIGMERKRVQLTRNVEMKIADLWAQGLRERDADMVQEARQELLEWNQANPQSRIQITNAQVLRRLREMQSTRAERFQRAAPKELRQGLAIQ